MKIAVLTSIINRRSGARAPLEAAKALRGQGNDITVFALNVDLEKQAEEELKKAGIKVSLMPPKGFFGPFSLYRKLKGGHFDVISFHWAPFPSFLVAWVSGIPIVRTYYGSQLNPLLDRAFPKKAGLILNLANRLTNKLIIIKEKFVLINSTKVLAISSYTQKELKKIYGISSQLVYLGAAPATFKKTPKKTKKEILILSVSRLVSYKGFHQLIEVFNELNKEIPQLRLTLVGSAPNLKYLSYLKSLKNENVRILTDISDQKLAQLYQGADIYATFDRYMFFGMPILEAATFGLPTVAIARCAALETIKHGQTGYLAKDEAEFSRFLEKLIKNKKIRKKLGQEASKNSQNFSWKNLAQEYQRVFEKIKGERRERINWGLAGIILLGVILRLAFINQHSFWFDEAFSFFVAQKPLPLLLKTAAIDTIPPFYFLLLKLWSTISVKVVFLRSLSLVFGLFTLLVGYQVFKRLTNSKIALLATSFLALSPLHLYYSTETRMYSLLVFETLFLFWFFLKFFETKNKLYLGLTSLGGILALFTHYYSVLILLSLNLLFLVRIKKYRPFLKSWLISQLIILLFFAPWLFWTLQNSKTSCWCFPPWIGLPATFASFLIGGVGVVTLKDFVFYGPRLPLVFFFASSLLGFTLFLFGLWQFRHKIGQNLNLLGFFFIPVLTASVAGLFLPIFSPRALIIISPFYYLLIAIGIFSIKNKLVQKWIITCLLFLIAVVLIFQYLHPFFGGPPIKEAAGSVAERYQKGEAILHTSPMTFYSFLYFHQESYPEFLVPSPEATLGTIFEIGGYQKKIDEVAPNYQKIWLVNTKHWVSPEEVEKMKKDLESYFALDQEVSYNNIQLGRYNRR